MSFPRSHHPHSEDNHVIQKTEKKKRKKTTENFLVVFFHFLEILNLSAASEQDSMELYQLVNLLKMRGEMAECENGAIGVRPAGNRYWYLKVRKKMAENPKIKGSHLVRMQGSPSEFELGPELPC